MDSVFNSCNSKQATLIAGLDLSAAFDTIDQGILLSRIKDEFGVDGAALAWLTSYLTGRSQFVKLGTCSSPAVQLTHGVPQGSVLGPLLFTTYISPVSHLITSHNLGHHHYADDTQLFISITPKQYPSTIQTLTSCINAIETWFLCNNLQFNTTKTEISLLGSFHLVNSLSHLTSIHLGDESVTVSPSLKILGVSLDNKLTFSSHITSVIKSCNYHLRAIRHIRPFLTIEHSGMLMRCLLLSRIDYCNSIFYNITNHQISRLQRLMNRAARLALNIDYSPYKHHQPSISHLVKLHWLPISYRIHFKIALLTYKTLATSSPAYLHNLLSQRIITKQLRSSASLLLQQKKTVNNISQRAFRHSAPAIWNSLPPVIRASDTHTIFKSKLKTHYFKLFLRTFESASDPPIGAI